jgi:hypothetical protein
MQSIGLLVYFGEVPAPPQHPVFNHIHGVQEYLSLKAPNSKNNFYFAQRYTSCKENLAAD